MERITAASSGLISTGVLQPQMMRYDVHRPGQEYILPHCVARANNDAVFSFCVRCQRLATRRDAAQTVRDACADQVRIARHNSRRLDGEKETHSSARAGAAPCKKAGSKNLDLLSGTGLIASAQPLRALLHPMHIDSIL